eukprot:g6652.t1
MSSSKNEVLEGPATGKRKKISGESSTSTEADQDIWDNHDERLNELGVQRRQSNRLRALSGSVANVRSFQTSKRVRRNESLKRRRGHDKADVPDDPLLFTPKTPNEHHHKQPKTRKIHTSKLKAKTHMQSQIVTSPSPSSISPMASRICSPKLSPNALSLLMRDEGVDLATFLTRPPCDFALDVFGYLTLSDILSVSKACKVWKGLLADTPVMVDALAFGERRQVFQYLQKREHSQDFHVGPWQMKQPHITAKMRSILVGWLEQVNREFENNVDTLFLAIRMVDCFFYRAEKVERSRVQLVGVAALLISAKLEETHYPDLDELLYLCDSIYTRKELLDMEAKIMCALNHTLHMPSAYTFLKQILHEFPLSPVPETLCWYLVEQSQLDYAVVQFRPSLVAISIYAYVCDHFNVSFENALEFSGWSYRQLITVSVALYNIQREAEYHREQHVRTRYKLVENHRVADIQLSLSFVDRLLARSVSGTLPKSPG